MKNKDGNVLVHYRKSKEINSPRRVCCCPSEVNSAVYFVTFSSFFVFFILFIGWIRSCLLLLLLCTAA
jgi:hypothetical protein